VFVCDFVAALQVCQGQLYRLYVDNEHAFGIEDFWSFKQLLQCKHKQIYLKWVLLPIVLNVAGQISQLAFIANNQTIFAMHEGQFVTQESFAKIVCAIKAK